MPNIALHDAVRRTTVHYSISQLGGQTEAAGSGCNVLAQAITLSRGSRASSDGLQDQASSEENELQGRFSIARDCLTGPGAAATCTSVRWLGMALPWHSRDKASAT